MALYRPLYSVSYIIRWTALHRPQCSVLYSRGERMALYRPLYSVLYSRRGGRLATVPCVLFYRAGRRGQMSTIPSVRFYIGFSMAFRGGDGVRYPPPPCQEGRS